MEAQVLEKIACRKSEFDSNVLYLPGQLFMGIGGKPEHYF
jgi:hypothetical protein